jgi:hypothetical protein
VSPPTPEDEIRRVNLWKNILCFIRHLLPAELANDPMFPQLRGPRHLWEILSQIGDDVDKEIRSQLARVNRIILIEDGWTDSASRAYEGIWASGAFPNGQTLNVCIGQIPLKRADAVTIALSIQKRLNYLEITRGNEQKIPYIVGDSASVNQAMVREFNGITRQKALFIPCAAHALNLMMQVLWTAVRTHVNELMAVIEAIRGKSKFRMMAQEYQPQRTENGKKKKSHPVTIASAISVRWYSLEKMFSSAITLRPVIESYLSEATDSRLRTKLLAIQRGQNVPVPDSASLILDSAPAPEVDEGDVERQIPSDGLTPSQFMSRGFDSAPESQSNLGLRIDPREWELAETANEIFKAFKSVMLSLESDDFGMIADVWHGLLYIQQAVQATDHPVLKSGWADAQAILARWHHRYPNLPTEAQKAFALAHLQELFRDPDAIIEMSVPLYKCAALLRPSNLGIRRRLIDDDEWHRVLDCMRVVYEAVRTHWRITEPRPEPSRQVLGFSRTQDTLDEEDLSSEWDRYLSQRIRAREDANLHEWWQNHACDFPGFYRLAQLYLTIPPTSAGVERMFSKARRVLDRLRLRMKPERAELLVYLRENIQIVEGLRDAGVDYK